MAVDSVNDLNRLLVSSSDNGQVNPEHARERLKKATQAFEAVFVKQLLGQMRKSMTGSSLFGSSQQAGMYQDMMDDALSTQISKTGSFGLAKTLYKSMEKGLGLPSAAATPVAAEQGAANAAATSAAVLPLRLLPNGISGAFNEAIVTSAATGKQESR